MSYLSRAGWTAYATASESGEGPEKMLDANLATFWRSYNALPLSIWFDLGAPTVSDRAWVKGFNIYMPTEVEVYVSDTGPGAWGSAIASATWVQSVFAQDNSVDFPSQTKRWVLIKILAATSQQLVNEFNLESTAPPPIKRPILMVIS
jgi:hypothetical protein